MPRTLPIKKIAVFATFAVFAFFLVKLNSSSIRLLMNYEMGTISVNPGGTCALVEYQFAGGERGMDFSRLFQIADGDAFYRVVDLRSGKILEDSSNSIPTIAGVSLAAAAMGLTGFGWNKDGTQARFPIRDDIFHEWENIKVCEGETPASKFAGANCFSDAKTSICTELKIQLKN